MVDPSGRRWFGLSIRTLMIAIALCALFIAPPICIYHQLAEERLNMAMTVAKARDQTGRALDQARSAQVALNAAKQGSTVQPKTGNVWAALGVNHPVLKAGQTTELRIEFSLVNYGDKVIDPKIADSQIMINGKELAASVFGGVAKDTRSKALSPGDSLQFDVLLGDHFKEPATYRLSWKGTAFQSSEIVLRVLPEKAR
jgi:hypothetical protein